MPIHIYHYNTHSEQRFFLGKEHVGIYDLIGLNGNIVSHTPAGVAAFISNSGKDFYIDPQTHAFQHSTINLKRNISDEGEPPEYEFKPSIITLATERLKGIFSSVIENDLPIQPNVFLNSSGGIDFKIIDETCRNIFDFQRFILINEFDEETKELLDEDISKYLPNFLIPPYFYLSKHFYKDWLSINEAFYLHSKKIIRDLEIYYALILSKDILFSGSANMIYESISRIKPSGILLWIDDFIEEELSEIQIEKYIRFLKELKKYSTVVLNIHGGYLSILLCHKDGNELLNGVGHSINYGESRPVIPVGGGIPMARFYFPSIHSRLRYGDAYEIIEKMNYWETEQNYHYNVCKCFQCKDLIKSKGSVKSAFLHYGDSNPVTFRRQGAIIRLEYPTKEAKEAAARHYLYVKATEFDFLKQNKPLNDLCDDMEKTFNNLIVTTSENTIIHLNNWVSSLRKYCKLP